MTVKEYLLSQLTAYTAKVKAWVNGKLAAYALKTELPTDYLTDDDVKSLFNDVAYDSEGKKIQFKHDTSVVKELDATPFIKDGMVNEVKIADGTGTNNGKKVLLITFNTDSGKENIEIPLEGIFDANNYYNKTDADKTFVKEADWATKTADFLTEEDLPEAKIENGTITLGENSIKPLVEADLVAISEQEFTTMWADA